MLISIAVGAPERGRGGARERGIQEIDIFSQELFRLGEVWEKGFVSGWAFVGYG